VAAKKADLSLGRIKKVLQSFRKRRRVRRSWTTRPTPLAPGLHPAEYVPLYTCASSGPSSRAC